MIFHVFNGETVEFSAYQTFDDDDDVDDDWDSDCDEDDDEIWDSVIIVRVIKKIIQAISKDVHNYDQLCHAGVNDNDDALPMAPSIYYLFL